MLRRLVRERLEKEGIPPAYLVLLATHNHQVPMQTIPTNYDYGAWLAEIATQTVENFSLEERFIFINAWNEWAEGCHLEPDLNWGRQYLEATKAALDSVNNAVIPADDESPMARRSYSKAKGVYWQTLAFLAEQRDLLNNLLGRQG